MATDWQPIETAPRDGTQVYLFHSGALFQGQTFTPKGRWNDAAQEWEMSCYPFSKCGRFLITKPNLWMPLPTLPEVKP